MRLPKDLINQGIYTKPKIFLCETDKTKICQLYTANTKASFKFNSCSELSFEVSRTYNDILSGKTLVNPFYDKIEAPRLIFVENFGYFEIQNVELISNGIKEVKDISANSLEYTLSTKYLSDFYINTGEVGSVEVTYSENNGTGIIPVTLYDPNNKELSLLHLVLEKDCGFWKIGHVDSTLQKLSRQFEVDRESVYDFLMNEICEKFNCYVVFDTINNTINLYAESLTSKFIGDGITNTFTISPPFAKIGTVSVDGYKTTRWTYDTTTGALVLEDTPESGAHIEVVDGALEQWETDVFITFENLSQEININYSIDDLKTVLTVTYGEDGDIRETNLGLPYLTDLSYYYTVDWMGQDLYDAYTAYLQKTNQYQSEYTNNSQEMLSISDKIWFEENRLSLEYSIAQSVGAETVGTYYVRGGTEPNYYYTEVSLPADYNANTTYYSLDTANLNETKVSNLYAVLKKYFNNENEDDNSGDNPITSWKTELNKLSDDFKFMKTYFDNLLNELSSVTTNRIYNTSVEAAINTFLAKMWNEIGKTPLKMLYYEPYKKVQITNIEAGWAQKDNENYSYYYPVIILLNSIEAAIFERDRAINEYQNQYNTLQSKNATISNELLMKNNFTEGQLIRLSAFLREDELQLDDIIETDQDSIADSFKIKQDAMEAGRIELNKICQPQLQFSMSMANIYALPEFEPIVDQFQLGNVIKVGLRPDYIKQSRLLQVDINFEDFSDFSCEFGELTSLRSQSDIHADLLSKAITAGKSVATNASYWSKGSDKANSIDLRLQEGLLNSIEALKAMDGTQNAYLDKYGLHLEKVVNPNTGEIGDKRVWLCNNQIVFTDDGFKTSKAVLGECPVLAIDRETGNPIIDSETGEKKYESGWGLLAQAVIAGYIEGSRIRGGTIQIGEQTDGSYAFEVREDGSVVMNGGSQIAGYAKEENNTIVSTTMPATARDGQLWINTSTTPYTIMACEHTKYLNFHDTAAPDDIDIIYIIDPGFANQFITQIEPDTSASFDANGKVIKQNSSTSFSGGMWSDNNSENKVVTIFIGNNVTELQGGCFTGCPNLKTIYVNDGKWVSKQGNVYTSRPEQYYPGDLWILADGETYNGYQPGSILKADENLNWVDAVSNITSTLSNVNQYFEFDSDSGLKIGQKNEKFHVSINSTRMGFYDGDTEVVHISNQSANIDDLTVEKNFVADCNASFDGDITMNKTGSNNEKYSFSWRIEDNGSFSLVKN